MLALAVAIAFPGLSACASIEHSLVDATTIEGDLPPEARELATQSADDLVAYAPGGIREFEIARRFERGVNGFPQDRRCALVYYDVSGRTMTRIRQDMIGAGTQTLTYLGFPNARVAARRLRRDDPVPVAAEDVARCEGFVDAMR